jgi:acyl dehydratase
VAQELGFAAIEPGAKYRSPGRTLTETDHGLFMMLSGDWDPIHADEEYARGTPAGRRLMHGTLGIALAMGMQTGAVAFADPIIGALSLKEWVFRKPMFIGDTVHVGVEFLSRRVTSDRARYIVERRLSLVRHDGEVIQDGIAATMLRLPPNQVLEGHSA